ncbi:MAG: InlB B-repeat-containing protein [Bacteroidales bacterium]|jgi:hypothetical protein|nr:InlB B-repeat-containing protein [Bacteroidales bacterium]
MKKSNLLKLFLLCIAISGFAVKINFIHAQHLFSVNQNYVPQDKKVQLMNQITNSEITALNLVKNNENKDLFPVAFSDVQNTQIIILNEETGNNVVITPSDESLTEFLLAPFFTEELKQATLGEATHYLVLVTTVDFSVKSVNSISLTAIENNFLPQFFYGKKENVKEALPKDRQIINIFREKPRLISAFPDDPEHQSYIEQLEEDMSYYVYMYKLPDETLIIYDEHFNSDNDKSESKVGEFLEFILSGTLNATQRTATEYALSLWGEQLFGSVPVDISVSFLSLGYGVLGQSYRQPNYLDTETNTWYCSALGNQMAGYNVVPNMRDIRLEMSTNFSFYFGLDGNTSGYDYVTIMLHEVTHGLGFYPLCGSNGAYSYTTQSGNSQNTSFPGIFDRQLFQGLEGECITELNQSQRASLMISNNLYAGAPNSALLEANGGVRVKMYAPGSYQSGSSTSHWDQSVNNFQTFMKYAYAYPLHTFNTRKIGIMLDMGWTLPTTESVFVNYYANGGEGTMYPQQFTPDVPKPLIQNIFQKTGYLFTHWNTSPDGTHDESYEDGETISITEDIDLYAQWKAGEYTLSFNANGGTVDSASKQVTFDELIGELPLPERSGYTFLEWRIGPAIITDSTIWNYPQNMTTTAFWKISTHIITATAGEGGKISPSGENTVNEGSNLSFTITPDEEFIVSNVLIDGDSIGPIEKYMFENIIASHTIHAEFKSTIGIAEIHKNLSIQIIPNPAKNCIELRITNKDLKINQIEFYNIFGQLVKTVLIQDYLSNMIDISDLKAGIYMVKVGEKTVKLVVN